MQNQNLKNRDIAHSIFSGSTTMIGVCITVTALFKAMKIAGESYADEILSINTLIFIVSALLSYLTLRKNTLRNTEKVADILFFTGMLIMVIVGLIIVFTVY